jgi:hypothetical protein
VASPPAKVTVLLPQNEFARLDRYCREHAFKKSTLIAKLIREHLDREAAVVGETAAEAAPTRSRNSKTRTRSGGRRE